MKIALLADIHGNSWALNEILNDIKSKGIDTIINLGDSLNGPLDPMGTFNLLIENDVLSISGNGDRLILESLNSNSNKTLEYVKSQINDEVIEWLKKLPFEMIVNNLYCCHATPDCDTDYLLENLKPGYVEIKDYSDIDKILKDIKQEIVTCGHSHVPRIVKTAKKTIINAGSVGLPAYKDELPIPHKMETFNSNSNYTVLTILVNSIKIEQVNISYDFEAAANKANQNGRDDWAKWIKTGRG